MFVRMYGWVGMYIGTHICAHILRLHNDDPSLPLHTYLPTYFTTYLPTYLPTDQDKDDRDKQMSLAAPLPTFPESHIAVMKEHQKEVFVLSWNPKHDLLVTG